jgi:hypothetical protein
MSSDNEMPNTSILPSENGSPPEKQAITKENMLTYLKELSKEFRRLNGKAMPAEIILIGGAAVLANYGFRETTYDIDALIVASSAMKEAINLVGDKYGLQNGSVQLHIRKNCMKYLDILRHFHTF